MRPYFTHRVLHADDSYVTSVWNMVSRDGRNAELCGIEVFRAENGRFTDCWIQLHEEPLGRGGRGETRACLIDWQTVRSGDPQYDVAYFLSGSLSPQDRRACERDLIAEHVRAIFEIDGDYTFEAALESYRFNIVSGLWLTLVASAFIEHSEHNARLLETLVARNTAAIRDWDGLAAIEAVTRAARSPRFPSTAPRRPGSS
jgi:hypothetical protein